MALNQIGEFRKKFRQVDLSDVLNRCLVETSDILLDLVKSQLEVGKTSIGFITPQLKNESYARQKQSEGSRAPFGIPDLKKTGAFYRYMKVYFGKDAVRIRSTNKKAPDILRKYGKEIYELNQDNFEYYINEIIEPLMIKKIENGLS